MHPIRSRDRLCSKGFTLIELLIVIAIILILIAIALPNFLEAQLRAKVAKVKGDLRSVGMAMDSYLLDFKMYPEDHDPSEIIAWRGLFRLSSPIKYIAALPADIFNTKNSGFTNEEPSFELASTGFTPLMAKTRRPKVNAFVVFSHGPDRIDQFDDNDDWPFGAPATLCYNGTGYLNYSPTNGSSSLGDINQPGGEIRSGCYCVDRWQLIRGYTPPNTMQ